MPLLTPQAEGFSSVAGGLRPPMGSDPTLIDRRRVGKITLSHSMQGVSYFDCDLPRVRRIIEEGPEEFLGQDMKLLT